MSSNGTRMIQFGVFEVDQRSGELRRNGVKIKLQEQPFQILALLLERPGEVVTREELQSRLWPVDTFVDFDHSLNAAVRRLRDALGDSAENPRFVETVARPYFFNWSLSPDGSMLAMAKKMDIAVRPEIRLLTLKDNKERIIKLTAWSGVSALDWAADGKNLWVSASTTTGTNGLLNVDLQGRVHPCGSRPRWPWAGRFLRTMDASWHCGKPTAMPMFGWSRISSDNGATRNDPRLTARRCGRE